MSEECPYCGQQMLVRFGIQFPTKKAEILDLIASSTEGRGGVDLDALAWVFHPNVFRKVAKQRIKVHVNQINDLLASTDWQIVKRDGLYRLVERVGAA
jgi:hypothetical protein